jgi:hypothetical protein
MYSVDIAEVHDDFENPAVLVIEVPPSHGRVTMALGWIHDLTLDLDAEVSRRQPDVTLGEIEELLGQSPHEQLRVPGQFARRGLCARCVGPLRP